MFQQATTLDFSVKWSGSEHLGCDYRPIAKVQLFCLVKDKLVKQRVLHAEVLEGETED